MDTSRATDRRRCFIIQFLIDTPAIRNVANIKKTQERDDF